MDYTAVTSQTVTFAPGETCVSVVVSVTDDEVHEKDETFVGSLKRGSSTPDNVLIGNPSMAVATIIDDDDLSKTYCEHLQLLNIAYLLQTELCNSSFSCPISK